MLEVPLCIGGLVGQVGGVGGGLGVLEIGEHIESIDDPCWRHRCICRERQSGWAREVFALRICLCEGGLLQALLWGSVRGGVALRGVGLRG